MQKGCLTSFETAIYSFFLKSFLTGSANGAFGGFFIGFRFVAADVAYPDHAFLL
jgi:hypothetical protein